MVSLAAFLAVSLAAQTPAPPTTTASLAGAWTLNKELSDAAPERGNRGGDDGRARGDGGRRGGYGGGGGRGGFGGRGMGRGQMGNGAPMNPEDSARMRDA